MEEQKRMLTADEQMALQARIAKGQRMKDFMRSPFYREDIEPFLHQIGGAADVKAIENRASHSETSFWLGVRHSMDFLIESLETAAKEAELSLSDIPEDQSPVISQ